MCGEFYTHLADTHPAHPSFFVFFVVSPPLVTSSELTEMFRCVLSGLMRHSASPAQPSLQPPSSLHSIDLLQLDGCISSPLHPIANPSSPPAACSYFNIYSNPHFTISCSNPYFHIYSNPYPYPCYRQLILSNTRTTNS